MLREKAWSCSNGNEVEICWISRPFESYLTTFPGHFRELWPNLYTGVAQEVENPIGWIGFDSCTGVVCWAADGHTLEGRVAV